MPNMQLSDIELFINGKRVNQKTLPVNCVADMPHNVFESMAGFANGIFRLDQHLNRLFASAKTVGVRFAGREAKIKEEVIAAFRGTSLTKPIFLRLMIDDDSSVIWVNRRTYPNDIYTKGVEVNTSPVPRNLSHAIPPEAKTGQFLNGILASLDPPSHEVFEMIHLGQSGDVKEARTWNLFIIKKRVLRTPEGAGILDGVTRRFVIECAHKEKIKVLETALTRHDIWNADEAFLTNTSGGIVPIHTMDGRSIGQNVPGVLTQQLTKRFHRERDLELKTKSIC